MSICRHDGQLTPHTSRVCTHFYARVHVRDCLPARAACFNMLHSQVLTDELFAWCHDASPFFWIALDLGERLLRLLV